MIWALIIFVACLTIKLAIDLRQYHSRKTINHGLEAVFVATALVGVSWLAGWYSLPMWFFGWTCLFDPAFSLLIGQKPFYIGETAALDKIQRKYPFLQLLKYLLLTVSIIFFILKHKQ